MYARPPAVDHELWDTPAYQGHLLECMVNMYHKSPEYHTKDPTVAC